MLLLLGVVLPYLTLEHFDAVVRGHPRDGLAAGAGDLTGLDATYLPSYDPEVRPDFNVAFNVLGIGPTLQIFGSLVAAVTCWGLFYDEINKFFWWPLHLSGYLLIAVPIPLFIGLKMVRDLRVDASCRPRVDPGGAGRHPDPRRHSAGPRPDRHLRRSLGPPFVLLSHPSRPGSCRRRRLRERSVFRIVPPAVSGALLRCCGRQRSRLDMPD